jgi:hypothetical protein
MLRTGSLTLLRTRVSTCVIGPARPGHVCAAHVFLYFLGGGARCIMPPLTARTVQLRLAGLKLLAALVAADARLMMVFAAHATSAAAATAAGRVAAAGAEAGGGASAGSCDDSGPVISASVAFAASVAAAEGFSGFDVVWRWVEGGTHSLKHERHLVVADFCLIFCTFAPMCNAELWRCSLEVPPLQ